MPVRKVKKGNRSDCYRWGNTGKIYCGKGAKAKATKQGRAAYVNGYRGKK
jgi:hypothetical protein